MRPAKLIAAAALAGASIAIASGEQSAKSEAADVLRGPAVNVDEAPGVEQSLTMQPDRYMRAAADARIPRRKFMAALKGLGSAGPDLAPSAAQVEAISAIERDLQSSVRAYRRQHQAEIGGLKATLGPAAEKLRGPKRNEAMQHLTPEQFEAAKALKSIRDAAPRPEAAHALMWRELTPVQQAWVEAKLDETVPARRRQARQEAMGYARPDAEPPTAEALMARFDRLPKAQQRIVRRELDKMLERAEASAARTAPPAADSIEAPALTDAGSERPSPRRRDPR